MFKLTKKPNLFEEQRFLAAIAGTVDELERYEASDDALGASLLTLLKIAGYSEEKAMTAALLTVKALENDFSKMYWQDRTFSHKVAVIVSIFKTAEQQINNGNIDKRTMALIKMAMEDVKNEKPDKSK